MRGDYQREKTSGLTWLLSAIIAGFVLQVVLGSSWFGGASNRLDNLFALTIPAVQDGWLWTLATHSFLHSPGFIFHVVANCLALYFLGRELIPMLGSRRFFGLYAAATVIGGLAWLAVHWRFGVGEHTGASPAVYALFMVFACFFPNRPMSFLLFFVFPVSLKPKHVAAVVGAIEFFLLFVHEIPGLQLPFGIALSSSAHIGGMIAGLVYYRFVHEAAWFNPQDRAEVEAPAWMRRVRRTPPSGVTGAATATQSAIEVDAAPPAPSRADLRAEVDRILDKINSQGFGALTPAEKRALDNARDLLSRP